MLPVDAAEVRGIPPGSGVRAVQGIGYASPGDEEDLVCGADRG